MASAFRVWLLAQRLEITDDLKWFGAGAILTSPSGKDITEMKVRQLETRLAELDKTVREIDRA